MKKILILTTLGLICLTTMAQTDGWFPIRNKYRLIKGTDTCSFYFQAGGIFTILPNSGRMDVVGDLYVTGDYLSDAPTYTSMKLRHRL